MVERKGERQDAGPAHKAVGRLDARETAKRGGVPDLAPGVTAGATEHETRRYRSAGSA